MTKLDKAIIAKLNGPIHNVWNDIGSDVDAVSNEMGEETTNAVAIESCIDAGRLTTNGHKEADELLDVLFKEHGYDKVFKFLNKNIRLA